MQGCGHIGRLQTHELAVMDVLAHQRDAAARPASRVRLLWSISSGVRTALQHTVPGYSCSRYEVG